MSSLFSMNIFWKLLLTFMLVITPLYTLSLWMNMNGSDMVKDEITKSTEYRIVYFLEKLEEEFTQTINMQRKLANNKDLYRLSRASDALSNYQKGIAIQEVLDVMNDIKDTGTFTKDVRVYIPAIQRELSTNSIIDFINTEFVNEFVSFSSESTDLMFFRNNQLLIPQVLFKSGKKDPFFVSVVEIDIPKMKESLATLIEGYQGGYSMLSHEKWSIVNSLTHLDMNKIETLEESLFAGEQIRINEQDYLNIRVYSTALHANLIVMLPTNEVYGLLSAYRIWFWVLCSLSLIIVLFFSYWIYRLIHHPILVLIRSFRKVETGDFSVAIHSERKDEFNYLYHHFNVMVHRLQVSHKEVYEQESRTRRAEQKQLQSQINPHFLYNCFFILNDMVQKHKDEQLNMFTKQLGQYFQYITRNSSDFLDLETEVNHVQAYTSIQMIRHSKRINILFEPLPDRFHCMIVPRMILQPIIENSFEHALEQKLYNGIISIRFYEEESYLNICVEDNGEHLTEKQLEDLKTQIHSDHSITETTGLLNVHTRLRLFFNEEAGLFFYRSSYGGLLTVMRLPIRGIITS